MPNNKSPGNDGHTKKFYEVFWEDLKTPLIFNFKPAFDRGELSNSQKQTVIRSIEKKGKDKKLFQNYRSISLLNVDLKIISKALADCIKKYLRFLILLNQIACVDGRLFSDILQVTNFSEL